MLSFEDILNAQRLRRMAGQFPSGHYDHDARLAIGPVCVSHTDQLETAAPSPQAGTPVLAVEASESQILQLTVTFDPHTGEPIFDGK